MGGNAMKSFGTIRINEGELSRISLDISEKLNAVGALWGIPPHICEKKSHGDIDVLVSDVFRKEVAAIVSGMHSKPNGPVVSAAWPFDGGKLVQVDFIFVKPDEYEYAFEYFSYNDIHNLIGRTAHKMGLKHGHDGLKYIVRDGVQTVLGEIVLTRDFAQAMKFLGFSHERYLKGFHTLEEIYHYVSDHPKFSPKMFDLNERNHIARMRDRKRPTYTGFLSWIEKNRRYLGDYDWPTDKDVWLQSIFAEFPESKTTYDSLWNAHKAKESAKMKFNGVMVGQLTGLREKPLGRLIQAFKEAHPDWVAYVNASEQRDIDSEVMTMYNDIFKGEFHD
jgi:hypothetical protein